MSSRFPGKYWDGLLQTFDQPESLASNDVRALLEDRGGRLWIGTADGLQLLARASQRVTHFRRIELCQRQVHSKSP